MAQKPSIPKGTRDFSPLEMMRRLALGLPQPACTAFPAEEPAHLMQKGAPARDV